MPVNPLYMIPPRVLSLSDQAEGVSDAKTDLGSRVLVRRDLSYGIGEQLCIDL